MPTTFGQVAYQNKAYIILVTACHCMHPGSETSWLHDEYDIISEEEYVKLKAEHICQRNFSIEEIRGRK